MSSSQKIYRKGTLRKVFICLRPPPHIGSCLEWCSKFVGSEYGQIQGVKLLQNMVSNRIPQPPPPPLHTGYCILIHTGKGGVGGEMSQKEG